MAKGIRVSQLAKELGVPSKAIVEKCRAEGLSDKVATHSSVLGIGLAETVREWFTAGEGGTAVEVAPPVKVAARPRTRPQRKKTEPQTARKSPAEEPEEPQREEPAVSEPEGDEQVAAVEPAQPPATPEAQPVAEVPPATEPAEPSAPAELVAPVEPSAPQPPVEVPAVPAATAPAAAPRPMPKRKPVTPAPRVAPAPARIQGPRLIREERPEHVPAPRPRRPAPAAGPAGVTPARPLAGRGVKSATTDDEDASTKKRPKTGAKSLSSRRRGFDGRRGEAMEKLKEYTEADLIERRERLSAATSYRTGFDTHLRKAERGQQPQARRSIRAGEPIEIEEPITVKTLSSALGIKGNDIIGRLMRQGTFVTINQTLDREAAETLALEYGLELKVKQQPSLEEQLQREFEERMTTSDNRRTRPPVVTILGHVDHGKTSLLDRIRNANVAAGEAGGITQHTAAWMVELGEGESAKRVTFIDTPGHQAFTSMRARGANMTDVVVLVVSAAEGVQPQTVESINHARAAGVPIVVALNKIDRPDANPDMVLGQLAAQDLQPIDWGGDVEVVRTSAITGQGIEDLIEILHYQAELLELKADPDAPATGSVIEARVDEGLGPVATVLVQNGTLKVGDVVLAGPGYGRVRSLFNDRRQSIPQAGPSTPVIVSGLDVLPAAGDRFFVLNDVERARAIAEERQNLARQETLAQRTKVTLDNLFDQMKAGSVKEIRLIIKADVQGSVETLAKTVTDANTDEVKVRVIHSAVGAINESDVELADASDAVIIGFHVASDEAARTMAEQRRVEVRLYRVIYEIFDDLKKALSGLLEPEVREKFHGRAEIRQVFKVSRLGNIAGCMVTDGHIQRGSKIRLIRDGTVITENLSMESLRRVKEDVREVRSGFECGIKLSGYDDIKTGDILEAYSRETIQRTL